MADDRSLPFQSLLSAIVQSSDDAIISKDLNSIVTSWNPAAERLFGYTASEMIGRSIRTLIPPDRQHEEDLVIARLSAGQSIDHFDTVRLRKDGSLVYISLTISPIRDASGVVIGASKIARDVSDRLRAQAASERTRQRGLYLARLGIALSGTLDASRRLAALVELSVPHIADWCAVDIVTAGGRIEHLATKHVGPDGTDPLASASDRNRDVQKAAADVIRTGVAATIPVVDAGGRLPMGSEESLRSQSPESRLMSYVCLPLVTSGHVAGALAFAMGASGRRFDDEDVFFLTDVASRAALAVEGARAYEELKAANRTKDEFLATLSHELRTPLNAILGYARMLRSGILKDDRKESAIGVLERNATSLTQIVEDVLDISRIASGKIRLDVQPLDLAAVLGDAVATVMPASEAKGVRLELSIDQNAPLVSGDSDRLQQVVWNLLSNAVKFTPTGGHVHVQLRGAGRHVEVRVADTGIGIRREFLPHLFERFRQADSTTTRTHGGLGLGLAIAQQIVELHGGTISASSDGEGKGAVFCVELPSMERQPKRFHAESSASDDSRSKAPGVAALAGARILVVDDDADSRDMIREILASAGATVLTAGSAPDALAVIHEHSPDLLISDLAMPGVDGFELIRRVRTLAGPQRDMLATALTAFARSEDRARALRAGFEGHIAKPVDPIGLIESLRSLIERRTAIGSGVRTEML